jgi:hypothetical protein
MPPPNIPGNASGYNSAGPVMMPNRYESPVDFHYGKPGFSSPSQNFGQPPLRGPTSQELMPRAPVPSQPPSQSADVDSHQAEAQEYVNMWLKSKGKLKDHNASQTGNQKHNDSSFDKSLVQTTSKDFSVSVFKFFV